MAGLRSTAVRQGDYYILNGQKTWISLCDTADHFLVFVYTGDRDLKHKGISAFIVERTWEGFSSKATKGKLGICAGNRGELFFENLKVPKENLLWLQCLLEGLILPKRIVIVGGVGGGAMVAAQIRRQDPNAQITIFEKRNHIAFSNC